MRWLAPRSEILLASAAGASDVASPLAACARRRADDLFHLDGSSCQLSGNYARHPHERAALKRAVEAFVTGRDDAPNPFQWAANADDMLAKVGRFAQRTLTTYPAL